MPVHDWSRVEAGIFHSFHGAWIGELGKALNGGLLPPEYYALGEQNTGGVGPDVTLEDYTLKQRTLVIRQSSKHRIVALIEILSTSNKSNRHAMRSILDGVVAALMRGIHLLLIDLHPRDSLGIHQMVWERLTDDVIELGSDKPLTLVAYVGGVAKQAYLEQVAVGDALPDMPLFLDPEWYVNVPLEATYRAAYEGVPRFYRNILEGPPA